MNKQSKLNLSICLLSCFVSLPVLAQAVQPKPYGASFFSNAPPKEIETRLSMMSGQVAEILAKKFGITAIEGKDITGRGAPVPRGPKSLSGKSGSSSLLAADTPVGTDLYIQENEPSIAVKPNNNNIIITVFHRIGAVPNGITIGASRSLDNGQTWSMPSNLPTVLPSDRVADPVVRWAPDSSYVYATYMSIRSSGSTADIVVVRSNNNGATWSAPVIAIRGGDYDGDGILDFPDKPWLDVHPFATTDTAKKAVYVTTTLFNSFGGTAILQNRSLNQGASFPATPNTLASTPPGSNVVIQGSRPIGGTGGEVLVCWYNSGADGWLYGGFDIRCTRSTNYGANFGGEFIAVNNITNELPYYLGPFASYHRWWGGMFPAMTVTPDGTAHLVVAADSKAGSATNEDGDIYYSRSPRPWLSWSRPTKISNDPTGRAQGYPTITTKSPTTSGSILFVAWEDHRNSISDNEFYDIFGDMTVPAFGEDIRVSDISSLSEYGFIGDYIDASTSRIKEDRVARIIWTDRSDKVSIYDYEDDVYSDTVELIR